jgi:hypothetical protein
MLTKTLLENLCAELRQRLPKGVKFALVLDDPTAGKTLLTGDIDKRRLFSALENATKAERN